MKLLYLDFGDPLDNATGNTIPKLRHKLERHDMTRTRLGRWYYGDSLLHKIDVYPCIAEVTNYLSAPLDQDPGELPRYDEVAAEVRMFFLQHSDCTKVMVGMHGLAHDTTHGYALPSEDAPKASYLRVADLLMMLIGDYFKHTQLKLTLVMCYGARSSEYEKSHDATQLGTLNSPNLSTSFAFRLYSLLCKHMKVIMSARTGALSFDDQTGASRVESEFTVLTDLRIRRNPVKALECGQARRDMLLGPAIDEFMNQLQPPIDMYDQQKNRQLDREANAFAKRQVEELEGDDLLTRIKREAAYSLFKQSPKSKPAKSGKIMYEYDEISRKVIIKCKYPQLKVVQRVSI